MKEIINELYQGYKEKTGNPFIRYFIISWIIINYKFWYILFFQDEKTSLEQYGMLKIDYLREIPIYGNIYWNIWFIFILPFLSALFFLYIYPWINRKFILKDYLNNKDKDAEMKQKFLLKSIDREIERNKKKIIEKESELKVKETENKIDVVNSNKEFIDEYYEINNNNDIFKEFDKIIEFSNLHKAIATDETGYGKWIYNIPEDIINKYIYL